VLYAEVADAVDLDGVPVVLSGDCTTALAVMAGVQRAGVDPALVWFDAHGDLQTPETSTSGYLGGFPVRQLVGGSDRSVPDRLGLRPVPESDVLLVDARDLDPPEAEFLRGSAIRRVPVDAVVEALPEGPVHLHVDATSSIQATCRACGSRRRPARGCPRSSARSGRCCRRFRWWR